MLITINLKNFHIIHVRILRANFPEIIASEIAVSKILEYIEMFYSAKRRYSDLGYVAPNEFESV